jgi:hypothetical protein
MSIIGILIALLVIGFICWIIQSAPIPISPWFKTVIVGIIAIVALIWVLNALGFGAGVPLRIR